MTTLYTPNLQLALPDFRTGPWHDLINSNASKIDAILFGAMSQGNVAPWLNATAYTTGMTAMDIVDASVWLCVVANTSAAKPITFAQERTNHPTYWTRLLTGFAPRGEWAQNTNYFPYDLAYDSGRGVMALCITRHTSTATGSILDDKLYWTFLLDMSDVGQIIATAVTYSNTASGIPPTDVQHAIDYVETQIVALNNVNVTQGDQITAIQTVNTNQDTQIAALTAKNTFTGVVTAPHFVATDAVSTQFGGNAGIGFYVDTANIVLRPPGSGAVYFQSQGGGANYGNIGPGGLTISGVINAGGAISTSGALAATGAISSSSGLTLAGNASINGGGIYLSGWGGNGALSVIFLNSAQNHYMYHDGSNVTFSGVAAVYAGNGRLYGSSDFGTPVSNVRTAFAGDTLSWTTSPVDYNSALISGITGNIYGDSNVYNQIRWRQVQFYTNNWYTANYA